MRSFEEVTPERGKQIQRFIARRAERRKAVHLEARTGEQLPPLLELARIKASLESSGITQEEIDAELARSRERRLRKGLK